VQVVSALWAQREGALAALDPSQLRRVETGAARAADVGYIASVECGCEPRKDGHQAIDIIPVIPHGSRRFFFAEVRTTNSSDGRHPWYVIAVTANHNQAWRIAYLTFGAYAKQPPLHRLLGNHQTTAPITAADTRRMTRLAELSARYSNHDGRHHERTSYGATIKVHTVVRPARDGVFGLPLASGKVFSCYTLHDIGIYTLASGLQQNEARQQWGAFLAPGIYRTITIDGARTECAIGTGQNAGGVWLHYDSQIINTTGVPAKA
jgi:hypothetical protein